LRVITIIFILRLLYYLNIIINDIIFNNNPQQDATQFFITLYDSWPDNLKELLQINVIQIVEYLRFIMNIKVTKYSWSGQTEYVVAVIELWKMNARYLFKMSTISQTLVVAKLNPQLNLTIYFNAGLNASAWFVTKTLYITNKLHLVFQT
jgi:hypothetical protein